MGLAESVAAPAFVQGGGNICGGRPGWAETCGEPVMDRFRTWLGASGRRYHCTRYSQRDDIAEFTNILFWAVDAEGRRSGVTHVDACGVVKPIGDEALEQVAPHGWEVRFLPQDQAAAQAVIADMTGVFSA